MKKFLLLFVFMSFLAFKNPAYAMNQGKQLLGSGAQTVGEMISLKDNNQDNVLGGAAKLAFTTSAPQVVIKIVGLGIAGWILASAAGLNLPAVAPGLTAAIEECIETGECYFPKWFQGEGLGLAAMFGTLVPSFFTVINLSQAALQLVRLYKNYNSLSSKVVIYVIALNVIKWFIAGYSGWAYGLGDQYGAQTVGENMHKLYEAEKYCKDNKHECKGNKNLQNFLDTNDSYYNKQAVEKTGKLYRVLNRIGSASVGASIGLGFANMFVNLITELIAPQFRAEDSTVDIINSILGSALDYNKHGEIVSSLSQKGKAIEVIKSVIGIASFVLFQYLDSYLALGAELFNGAAIDQAQMDAVNDKRKELNNNSTNIEKLPLITTSNHGVIIPDTLKQGPNSTLLYANATLEQSTSMNTLIDLNLEEAQLMRDAKDEVGLANYQFQYALLASGVIINFLNLNKNWGSMFKGIFVTGGWRRYFLLGYIASSLASVIPYALNLLSWIGCNGANRSITMNYLVDYSTGKKTGSYCTLNKEELLGTQSLKTYLNLIIILFAWIGGADPMESTYDVVFGSSKIPIPENFQGTSTEL